MQKKIVTSWCGRRIDSEGDRIDWIGSEKMKIKSVKCSMGIQVSKNEKKKKKKIGQRLTI